MEKTFTYQIETGRYGDECDCEYFDYTVEHDDLIEAIVDICFDIYFKDINKIDMPDSAYAIIKKGLKAIIVDNDNLEELANDFEYELQKMFKQDALDDYKLRL